MTEGCEGVGTVFSSSAWDGDIMCFLVAFLCLESLVRWFLVSLFGETSFGR